MDYKVLKEEYVYEGFLKIKKADVQHDIFQSSKPRTSTLESLERGDSVAILLYEKDTKSFLFVNQFRYPTIENDSGWLLEIVAGGIEKDEDPESCAKREVEEEIGYVVKQLHFISNFYVSPGGTSERIFLYHAEVNSIDQKKEAGGTDSEDIQLVKLSKESVRELMQKNLINDGKTLMALQYYFIKNQ